MVCITKRATPSVMNSSPHPEVKIAVIKMEAPEISVLDRPMPLDEVTFVQSTLCESLILTLLDRALSKVFPNVASSPYGLGRSEEALAMSSRGAFCA